MLTSPPFGQADLTNCERELIHLAGSVQPHGVLLVLREPDLQVLQVSANAAGLLGAAPEQLLGRPLAVLEGDLEPVLRRLMALPDLDEPQPLQCRTAWGGRHYGFEGTLHRVAGAGLVLELERSDPPASPVEALALEPALLQQRLAAAVQRFSAASNVNTLADGVVTALRDLTGYDRVMVYKFDPDGHGQIVAEARHPRLESLLGHHYPASDIPQRARELYLRTRVRVLVDVHYVPAPLQPPRLPGGVELDMSLCHLRSMSPLHLQYLQNMGVTATLVVSLVREGRLWGLIAAHHYTPRNLGYPLRAACELLAEVIATRLGAIENYAHAQVALLVRRLEQRLIEATSTEGDWRLALFRNPRTLLQPLEATGAALFYDGEILSSGEVPSTPEMRALLQWVETRPAGEMPFHSASVARDSPALESLTPVASGVLAVKLSDARPDYLMWFRKEQLTTLTWAGDPSKPIVGNDPRELSPRRSFAAWSELVRGTALPWSAAELALARAVGTALVDIVLQVHAVRLLIAEHQLAQTRATVQGSKEPVLIADAQGQVLLPNAAFQALVGPAVAALRGLDEVPALFTEPAAARQMLQALKTASQPWRGELALARGDSEPLPVSVRAEVVPGRDGQVLGYILILIDRSDSQRAAAARRHLEESLSLAAQSASFADIGAGGRPGRRADDVIQSILTNASLAAMDIADASSSGPSAAPLLEELESSTRRAAALYGRIRRLGDGA